MKFAGKFTGADVGRKVRSGLISVLLFLSPILADANTFREVQCAILFGSVKPVSGWTNRLANADSIRKKWAPNKFSSPSGYDPRSFRFIVRAIILADRTVESVREQVRVQALDELFSASLISNEVLDTYSDWGFVLEIPPGNIIATTPFDHHSRLVRSADTVEHFERFGIHTPSSLLRETVRGQVGQTFSPGSVDDFLRTFQHDQLNSGSAKDQANLMFSGHNEIKFHGVEKGKVTRVVGLFIQSRTGRHLGFRKLTEEIAQMRIIAQELGLPLVVLPEFERLGL